ncbi:MAG TPA: hypothetical protein VEN79_18315 [Terriglobia bacterium]|nr:hypothetical protein [Terriglobia bacterium]
MERDGIIAVVNRFLAFAVAATLVVGVWLVSRVPPVFADHSMFSLSTGPGFVIGWGNGSIVSAVQPGTSLSCDMAHVCMKTAQGASDAVALLGGGTVGTGTFQAVLDIDFPSPTSNGAGGACYPVTGQLAITTDGGLLALKVQGSDCALGTESTLSVITGSYVVDAADSTSKYRGVSGVGAFNWSADSSVSPADVQFALTGNLHFPS